MRMLFPRKTPVENLLGSKFESYCVYTLRLLLTIDINCNFYTWLQNDMFIKKIVYTILKNYLCILNTNKMIFYRVHTQTSYSPLRRKSFRRSRCINKYYNKTKSYF